MCRVLKASNTFRSFVQKLSSNCTWSAACSFGQNKCKTTSKEQQEHAGHQATMQRSKLIPVHAQIHQSVPALKLMTCIGFRAAVTDSGGSEKLGEITSAINLIGTRSSFLGSHDIESM